MNTVVRSPISKLLGTVVAISLLAGCGGQSQDDAASDETGTIGEMHSAITGGNLLGGNSTPYSSVVALSNCSALKLNGGWYLTAHHCAFAVGQNVTVTNALNPTNGPSYNTVIAEVANHPTTFLLPVVPLRFDLTLVRLVDGNPIPAWVPRYVLQSNNAGGRGVGYGCDNAPGSKNGYQKQWADFSTAAYPDQGMNMYFFASYGDPSLCPGDSGGPFFRIINTKYYLSGLASGQNQGANPHFSFWARINPANQWITAVAAGLPSFNDLRDGIEASFLNKAGNFCASYVGGLSQSWCRMAEEPEQRFAPHFAGGAQYEFRWIPDPSKCLAIQGASTAAGAPVTVLPCDGSNNTRWTVNLFAGDTRFALLINSNSGKCMVPSNPALGADITQQACLSDPLFAWLLSK
jgi:hypothetical protein